MKSREFVYMVNDVFTHGKLGDGKLVTATKQSIVGFLRSIPVNVID